MLGPDTELVEDGLELAAGRVGWYSQPRPCGLDRRSMTPASSSVRSRADSRLCEIRPTPCWISLKWWRSNRTISRRISGVQRSAMTSLASDTGQICW